MIMERYEESTTSGADATRFALYCLAGIDIAKAENSSRNFDLGCMQEPETNIIHKSDA